MLRKGLFLSIIVLLLASCADDTTSSNQLANLKLISILNSRNVIKNSMKNILIQNEVDSLKVTNFRMLISSIKLHGYLESEDKNESLKTGPFVLKGDSTNNFYFLTDHSVPEGIYDKIKLEIHKFPESERVHYEGDTLFGEFATTDKYTILIDGYYFEDGKKIPFEIKSDLTENINLDLGYNYELQFDGDYVKLMYLEIVPEQLFVKDSSIIKPTEGNLKDIFKNIDKAIKAM